LTLKDVIDILSVYSIEQKDFPENLVVGEEQKLNLAYCDHEGRTIYIDKNVSVQRQKEIILHELVHAWLHLKGKRDSEKTVNRHTKKIYKELYED